MAITEDKLLSNAEYKNEFVIQEYFGKFDKKYFI
jgi:hypothetical protein